MDEKQSSTPEESAPQGSPPPPPPLVPPPAPPSSSGAAAPPPDPGPAAPQPDRLSRTADAAAAAVSRSAPALRDMGARLGNWLASIGWGKFILLALLLLILSSVAEDAFHLNKPHKKARVPVDVIVNVDRSGLHITAPQPPAPPPDPGAPPSPPPPPAPSTAAPEVDAPAVSVDENGVRVQTDKHGHKVTVTIDKNGVRVIEKGKEKKKEAIPGADGASAGGDSVTVAPGVLEDPDKVDEAVGAAQDRIESIVRQQVEDRVAALDPSDLRHSEDFDLSAVAFLLIFTAMIVKVALGSKKRAESRAQVADAVAAEEGLKRQLAEAQIKTMQAQVEPHFLFNTLASVDYLIETDPTRASRMQKNLIQYLRAALPQMRQGSSTLGQELALCRSYLEILKVRMDERLQFTLTMPAGLSSAAFPPMMLQTLVENSIKHGLEPKPEGGALNLNASVVDGMLRVSVSDTGLGFGVAGASGTGVGLNNIRERLFALFGNRGRLGIEANHPSGTIATIEVPYSVAVPGSAPAARPAAGAADAVT